MNFLINVMTAIVGVVLMAVLFVFTRGILEIAEWVYDFSGLPPALSIWAAFIMTLATVKLLYSLWVLTKIAVRQYTSSLLSRDGDHYENVVYMDAEEVE